MKTVTYRWVATGAKCTSFRSARIWFDWVHRGRNGCSKRMKGHPSVDLRNVYHDATDAEMALYDDHAKAFEHCL